jgi:flavin reductase (DIM6/NTAB) family NADH-FMN oxidoreductase RutF
MIGPALGRVPSGLFVITFRDDPEAAMLASWVQQCSFEPPMISMAVKQGRDIIAHLPEGAAFAVNILAEGQKELLGHFGKGHTLSRLPEVERRIERHAGRAPALTDALAVLHCEVVGRQNAGDHVVFFAKVVAGKMHSHEQPYVHIRKSGLNY